jgi:hypothetical protein
MSGNQRRSNVFPDSMRVSVAGLNFDVGPLAYDFPMTLFSIYVSPISDISTPIAFYHSGADAEGAILDNVVLRDVTGDAEVPEPTSWALVGLGIVGVVARKRLNTLAQA